MVCANPGIAEPSSLAGRRIQDCMADVVVEACDHDVTCFAYLAWTDWRETPSASPICSHDHWCSRARCTAVHSTCSASRRSATTARRTVAGSSEASAVSNDEFMLTAGSTPDRKGRPSGSSHVRRSPTPHGPRRRGRYERSRPLGRRAQPRFSCYVGGTQKLPALGGPVAKFTHPKVLVSNGAQRRVRTGHLPNRTMPTRRGIPRPFGRSTRSQRSPRSDPPSADRTGSTLLCQENERAPSGEGGDIQSAASGLAAFGRHGGRCGRW